MARQRSPWWTAGGAHLLIRRIGSDNAHAADAFAPLLLLAERALEDQKELDRGPDGPGPASWFDPRQHLLVGELRRPGRAVDLWIYLFEPSQAELFVAVNGTPYRQMMSPSEISKGRFEPCTPRVAAERAGALTTTGLLTAPPPPPESAEQAFTPRLVEHSVELTRARSAMSRRGFGDGRIPRWPLGAVPHRLAVLPPDQHLDALGRCGDGFCDRCYRWPSPSAATLVTALAGLDGKFATPPPPSDLNHPAASTTGPPAPIDTGWARRRMGNDPPPPPARRRATPPAAPSVPTRQGNVTPIRSRAGRGRRRVRPVPRTRRHPRLPITSPSGPYLRLIWPPGPQRPPSD